MTNPAEACVLVCDDTAAKRYVISSWLRREGYTVVEAETGTQAIELASHGDIDLAVLDVHLPDMSGLDVCASIKSVPLTAATPVMHISAVAVEPEDRSAGLENGADAYMVDPIEPREMLSMIRALLRSSGARRTAERLAARLERLSAANLRINVALNTTRLASAASEAAARVLDTESVVVLPDERGSAVAGRTDVAGVTSVSELPPEVTARLMHRATEVSVVHAAEALWSEILVGSYDGPWRITPIHSGDDQVGLVVVPAPAVARDDDQMLVRRVAQTLSIALGNLRVFVEEHRTALVLQRSLLPASLPPLPGLVVAARYKASNEQAEVGGDFFDAFQTDDGGSVVVIGDVQGHSLEAAVVMAELRYSLRAYAFVGFTPRQVLSHVNAILLRGHRELTATLCMLVFPTAPASMVVANAGHLPPLVVRDGVASYVEVGGSLLGVDHPPDDSLVIPLSTGNRILLMTDGLVERRGEDITLAMDRLARDLEKSVAVPPEELCNQLMEQWGGGEDDVALIVLDVVAPGTPPTA
ncbi:MAG: SpoIIE family protein phosphatase [Nocardioidaceae bacterium]